MSKTFGSEIFITHCRFPQPQFFFHFNNFSYESCLLQMKPQDFKLTQEMYTFFSEIIMSNEMCIKEKYEPLRM